MMPLVLIFYMGQRRQASAASSIASTVHSYVFTSSVDGHLKDQVVEVSSIPGASAHASVSSPSCIEMQVIKSGVLTNTMH